MGVRGWPWWRLLIKITPMLNVHRTENQLKSQTVSFKTKMLNDFLTIFASFSRRSSTFFALNSRKWIKKGKSYEHRTKSSNLGYVPNIFNCYMNVNQAINLSVYGFCYRWFSVAIWFLVVKFLFLLIEGVVVCGLKCSVAPSIIYFWNLHMPNLIPRNAQASSRLEYL